MSFPSAKSVPTTNYQCGSKESDADTTFNHRGAKKVPVPLQSQNLFIFSNVSRLLRALFTSGDIHREKLDCELLEDRMGTEFICATQEFDTWWAPNECLMNE